MTNNLDKVYSDVIIAHPAFLYAFEQVFSRRITLAGTWNYHTSSYDLDPKAFDRAKLVIFSGGEDISPAIYGEKNRYSSIQPNRDAIEMAVLKHALPLGKKILGVCRGHQLVNAGLGGKLVQDIQFELGMSHNSNHELEYLNKESVVATYFERVNSMHHQGVITVGNGLEPTTFWNGVYESCESDTIITVQFHPEFMDYNAQSFFNYIASWANLQSNIGG